MSPENPVQRAEADVAPSGDAGAVSMVVQRRKAPKYSVFAALGAMAGIVAAMILSTVFDGTQDASRYTEVQYSSSQAFGFILLWCVPAGMFVGMLVALVLDRALGRRTSQARATREVVDD